MSIVSLLSITFLLTASCVSARPDPIITARAPAASSSSFFDVVSIPTSVASELASQDAAYEAQQSLASAPLAASDSAKLASEFARWTAVQAAAAAASATPTMAPLKVVNENAANGITCVSKSSDHGESFNSADCAAAIQTACRKVSESKTGAYYWDQWVWSWNGDCSMAYWMPESARNTTAVPSVQQCSTDVFGAMNTGCGTQNGGKSAASVNVAELPDGKGSVGSLVDPAKMGYLMAANPWRCDSGCSE